MANGAAAPNALELDRLAALREAQTKTLQNKREESLGTRQDLMQQAVGQTKTAKQKKAEESAKQRQKKQKERDEANDRISAYVYATPIGILWFNIQLIWGKLVTKGTSSFISPPSWRFLKVPLPDITAEGTIVGVDLVLLLMVFFSLLQWILLILLVYAFFDPLVMKELVVGMLGPVARFISGLVL